MTAGGAESAVAPKGFFADLAGRHVLLLQGPMGPFFARLAQEMMMAGARVSKVNLCAGDALFYRKGHPRAYRGTLGDWPAYFAQLVHSNRVEVVMLFGDCRPYHAAIRKTAQMLNVPIYVFEEGYLRPDYITLERGGVNGFSPLCRSAPLLQAVDCRLSSPPAPQPVKYAFAWAALYAMAYSLANYLGRWRYPHYVHHRTLHPLRQGGLWLWGGMRKVINHWRERRVWQRLRQELCGRYFVVPLQVHNDAQVLHHSRFNSVDEFIIEVIASFAHHAAPHHHLLLKHHPLDRPYRNYRRLIADTAHAYGVSVRVHYAHDLHLPTLLASAVGTVVINSTVGISSLCHRTPVQVLGSAVYDLPGLTHQGTLQQFWRAPGRVDQALFERFRAWLLSRNQVNGSFYRPLPDGSGCTGMHWFAHPPFMPVAAAAADLQHAGHHLQIESLNRFRVA